MHSEPQIAGTAESDSDSQTPTVLFVDDEANILTSLKRLFRPQGYYILTATSGAEGLGLLDQEKIDLVISDMRMPEMDGAEFLEKVRHKSPDTVRLLLTGYADMESTIAAINNGQIYRYISKPWTDDDIILTVRQALERKRLEEEKRALEVLTKRQNEELKELNSNLDAKVKERTKELHMTMASLEEAHDKLKKSFTATVRTFSNLVEMRGKEIGGHSRRVAEDARRIAQHFNLDDDVVMDIVFAGLLHDIGKMGFADALLRKPFTMLRAEERQEVVKHPLRGAAALMGLEQFQGAAVFIRAHHERYDGHGFPDGLRDDEIPFGARILAVANDYDSLQTGMLNGRRSSAGDAMAYLQEHKGSRYDPGIVDAFVEIKREATARKRERDADEATHKELRPGQLRAGMILARDLVTTDGLLLLSKGHALTELLVDQIRNFEHAEGKTLNVSIDLIATAQNAAPPH